jgi:hypothetical protein
VFTRVAEKILAEDVACEERQQQQYEHTAHQPLRYPQKHAPSSLVDGSPARALYREGAANFSGSLPSRRAENNSLAKLNDRYRGACRGTA